MRSMSENLRVIENPFGPGWAVVNELDIIVRTNPRRDIMERFAGDPNWRLWLSYDCIKGEKRTGR